MGRYTTVQAYSDTNQNTRSVSYEQATGSSTAKSGAVKAEKVDNPYGSTAGAGSGEFHVYRHARAREIARMKQLDEEEAERKADADFEKKVTSWKSEEDRKTEKRRKKRQREKEAKLRKKNMKLGGVGFDDEVGEGSRKTSKDSDVEEEFEYNPIHIAAKTDVQDDYDVSPKIPNADCENEKASASKTSIAAFANDGSFLETMKNIAEENASVTSNSKDDLAKSTEKGQVNDVTGEGKTFDGKMT